MPHLSGDMEADLCSTRLRPRVCRSGDADRDRLFAAFFPSEDSRVSRGFFFSVSGSGDADEDDDRLVCRAFDLSAACGFCGGSGEADDDCDRDRSDRFLLRASFSGSGERRRSLCPLSAERDGGDDSDRRGDELDRRRLRGGGGGGGDIRSFRLSLLRGGEGSGRRRLSLGEGEGE